MPFPLRTAIVSAALGMALASCGDDRRATTDRPPSPSPAGRVLEADDGSFDRIVKGTSGPVLVLFWAPWSGPDRAVLPHLDDVARERPELRVVRVDVDRAPELAQRYDVLAVPTAMVLVDGKRRGRPVVGALPRARWERELDLDALR